MPFPFKTKVLAGYVYLIFADVYERDAYWDAMFGPFDPKMADEEYFSVEDNSIKLKITT